MVTIGRIETAALTALSLGVLGLLVVRWAQASGAARRRRAPVVAAGIVLALGFTGGFLLQTIVPSSARTSEGELRVLVLAVLRIGVAVGLLLGVLRDTAARGRIADLVIGLADLPSVAVLESSLRDALGDPSVRVYRWDAALAGYRDADGRAATPPEDGPGQVVVAIDDAGAAAPGLRIALDPALRDDPGLVAAAVAAIRLAVENERLQAEVRTQLDDVRASRARIVEAQDVERRRLERDLHDGAQQRLVSLQLSLQLLRRQLDGDTDPEVLAELDAASAEARAAVTEIRELARGVHPAILSEAGLGAALLSLADRSPVPVTVASSVEERLPPPVEATAYFVVAEALTNVAKHADATRAEVHARRDGADLRLEISDDGRGGASIAGGTGLRGLDDRVAALGGTCPDVQPTRWRDADRRWSCHAGRRSPKTTSSCARASSGCCATGASRSSGPWGTPTASWHRDRDEARCRDRRHPHAAHVHRRGPSGGRDAPAAIATDLGRAVLSQYVEPAHAVRLLADGRTGVGYLLKDRVADVDELLDAVRRVAKGGPAIDPQVVAVLVGRRRDRDALVELTDREGEVLRLMAEGRSNGAISTTLGVGEKTVETHVAHISPEARPRAPARRPSPGPGRPHLAALALIGAAPAVGASVAVAHRLGGHRQVGLELGRHVIGRSDRGERRAHVGQPAVARDTIDGERGVAYPEPRMPALVVVRPRPAPVLGEEQGQPPLRRGEIGLGIQRPQDLVVGDGRIERPDQRLEEGHPARTLVEAGRVDHGSRIRNICRDAGRGVARGRDAQRTRCGDRRRGSAARAGRTRGAVRALGAAQVRGRDIEERESADREDHEAERIHARSIAHRRAPRHPAKVHPGPGRMT